MTEEADLLARIGELAGQINRRKNKVTPQESLGQLSSSNTAFQSHPSYPYRSSAGVTGLGRGQTFQNRSLIVNNYEKHRQAPVISPTAEPPELSGDENLHTMRRGVAKYGRGAKAWISEDALRRKLERRQNFANTVQAAEKDAVTEQNKHSKNRTSSPSVGYITIDDIQFEVTDGGSKLIRTTDTSTVAKTTPKEARVSGVTFKRSKNGNLFRAGFARQGLSQQNGKTKLCRQYTSTGTLILSPYTMAFPEIMAAFTAVVCFASTALLLTLLCRQDAALEATNASEFTTFTELLSANRSYVALSVLPETIAI